MKALNSNKQMKSVWNIGICIGNERLKDKDGKKVHSTQKPEQLLYNIIISSTKKDDIILDPFFGTGTTGAIAKKLGRHYIGIEKEGKYINVAKQRISLNETTSDIYSENELDVKPPRISLKELISMKYLQEGQTLYSKDRTKQVVLNHNGYVTFEDYTDSIHKVSARLLNRTNNNGWDYFFCEYKGEFVSINTLRYLADERRKQA